MRRGAATNATDNNTHMTNYDHTLIKSIADRQNWGRIEGIHKREQTSVRPFAG
jgi:hypothetical protein